MREINREWVGNVSAAFKTAQDMIAVVVLIDMLLKRAHPFGETGRLAIPSEPTWGLVGRRAEAAVEAEALASPEGLALTVASTVAHSQKRRTDQWPPRLAAPCSR